MERCAGRNEVNQVDDPDHIGDRRCDVGKFSKSATFSDNLKSSIVKYVLSENQLKIY